MRHRNRGRKLGRNPKHQRALLRSLASALILTERDAEFDENPPKVKGRIVTTVAKAKEVRPLVEKCITLACKSLAAEEAAAKHETDAERGSEEWKSWRQSEQWHTWNQEIAPAVAARRRCVQLLGDKQAVSILFEEIAPRYLDRPGGYTRIVRLPNPRLGDAGEQAIFEFVGVRDRVIQRSEKPAFETEDDTPAEEELKEQAESAEEDTSTEESAESEATEIDEEEGNQEKKEG